MSIDQVNRIAQGVAPGKAAVAGAGGFGFDEALLAAVLGDGTLEGAVDAALGPDAPTVTEKGKKPAAAAGDPLAAAMAALLIPAPAPLQPNQITPAEPQIAATGAVGTASAKAAPADPAAALVAAAEAAARGGGAPGSTDKANGTPPADLPPGDAKTDNPAKPAGEAKPLPITLLQPAAAMAQGAAEPMLAGPTLGRMAPRTTAAPTAARDPQVRPAGTESGEAASPLEPTPARAAPVAEGAAPRQAATAPAAGSTFAEALAEKHAGEPHGQTADKGAETFTVAADASLVPPAPVHAARSDVSPAAAPVEAKHPVEQVAVSLRQAAHEGTNEITIELRPANLGAVEVKLDFAGDGRVSAAILADRPDTLSLLKSDAGGLEQALRDAGLQADAGSLSFNLRGDQSQPDPRQFQQDAGPQRPRGFASAETPAETAAIAAPAPLRSHAGLLDIRI
jgi:flagellar hook-length control protein FliK